MVYVLELENGKYYVGFTRSRVRRINDHFYGFGSRWTQRHKPIRVLERIIGGDKELEKKKTLEYMKLYGWQNVRGGSWTCCEMKQPPPALLGEAGAERSGAGLGACAERPNGG